MAHRIDVNLMKQMKSFGAFDVSACFHCGNCTAVCPLSKEDDAFPRRLIRYGQLGMTDRLLTDKNLWLCYYCGECSETCPRQAEPGEFMASARRYAIARADFTGLARLMYASPWLSLLLFALFSAIFTLLLLWKKGGFNHEELGLFTFLPGKFIHDLGIGLFVVIAAVALAGSIATIVRFCSMKKRNGETLSLNPGFLGAAALVAIRESIGQARYRTCDEDKRDYGWHLKPWFVHASILWGFLGMLTATTLDFLLKEVSEWGMPVLDPMRLLGTISGLFCLYGIVIAIARRWKRTSKYYANSRFSDWFFLLLLAATVFSGFILEILVYSTPSLFAYILFLVHVVLAMDLIILMPITKFAHAAYRPLALFLDELYQRSKQQTLPQPEESAGKAA